MGNENLRRTCANLNRLEFFFTATNWNEKAEWLFTNESWKKFSPTSRRCYRAKSKSFKVRKVGKKKNDQSGFSKNKEDVLPRVQQLLCFQTSSRRHECQKMIALIVTCPQQLTPKKTREIYKTRYSRLGRRCSCCCGIIFRVSITTWAK